ARWASPPPHTPSAAVENTQRASVPGHHRRDQFMRAVECPRGAEVTNLFVAVGIAEHDLLDSAATIQLTPVDRVGEERVHRGRRSLQRIQPFEERHDIELTARWIAGELVKPGQPRQE